MEEDSHQSSLNAIADRFARKDKSICISIKSIFMDTVEMPMEDIIGIVSRPNEVEYLQYEKFSAPFTIVKKKQLI